MISNFISWDAFDAKSLWILQQASQSEGGVTVSVEVLRAITPQAILGVRYVGRLRAQSTWEELQKVLGTPDRGFDSVSDVSLSWEAFDPRVRWIIQAALGKEGVSLEPSLNALRSITLDEILRVRSVGAKRGQLAWKQLQLIMERHESIQHAGSSPNLLRSFTMIPPPPANVPRGDLVKISDLGSFAAKVLARLFEHLGTKEPVATSLPWLSAIDASALQEIEGRYGEGIAKFIKIVSNYKQNRSCRSASATALFDAIKTSKSLGREVLNHVSIDPSILPSEFSAVYEAVGPKAEIAGYSLGWVLAASTVELCAAVCVGGPEADVFVRQREDWFCYPLIIEALRAEAPPEVVRIAALVRIAMRIEERAWEGVWVHEAEAGCSKYASDAKNLLQAAGFPESSGEWVYLENLGMIDELYAGATLESLGAKHGITRERVRQRVVRLGYKKNVQRRSQQRRLEDQALRICQRAENFARATPGCTPSEMSVALGISIESAVQQCGRLAWLTLTEPISDEPDLISPASRRTAESSLKALKEAATLAYPLHKTDYDDLRYRRFIRGPSSARILQVFGSWKRACEAAGVECGSVSRREGVSRRWSQHELLVIVLRYLTDPRYRGQSEHYSEWRDALPESADLPSFTTILNSRGELWSRIRMKALIMARQSRAAPAGTN